MTVEYLVKLYGKKGSCDFWPEQSDGMGKDAPSLERTLAEIEDAVSDGYGLAGVLCVSFFDGEYHATDVTQSVILPSLHEREKQRKIEQYDRGEHNFYSLAGFLDSAEWDFPNPDSAPLAKLRAAE